MEFEELNSWALRRLQKQEGDEDKSRTAAGSEYQALNSVHRDVYTDSTDHAFSLFDLIMPIFC